MIFFRIQKAERTSVRGVLSASATRNRLLLFIRLSAFYLFLSAPPSFCIDAPSSSLSSKHFTIASYLPNRVEVLSGDLRRVSTDERSERSGDSATPLGEEVDLPNTPQGPGQVAAISVVPSAASHTCHIHKHPCISTFVGTFLNIIHDPAPYATLNQPN